MQCIHHTDRAATVRCTGCAEALCPDCHVEVAGGTYCQACKSMAVKTPPVILGRIEVSSQARNGMLVGLFGLVLFTAICGVVAIVLGSKARREIADNPRVCGGGMAMAAICLGCIDLLFFVINIANKH